MYYFNFIFFVIFFYFFPLSIILSPLSPILRFLLSSSVHFDFPVHSSAQWPADVTERQPRGSFIYKQKVERAEHERESGSHWEMTIPSNDFARLHTAHPISLGLGGWERVGKR